ncbi:DUF11 domain-containing protein, partial [Thiogranum longum]|uniref:DUF11 domain-containing protein n=1 Tax=Thiogranum longum TaxID=1537524 RepID=UPI001402FF18
MPTIDTYRHCLQTRLITALYFLVHAARSISAVTIPILLLFAFNPGTAIAAFQQDSGAGGVVSMEAENNSANVVASDGHAWLSAGGSFPGFAGTDALQALPADGVTHGSSYSTLSPQLDFQVNFVASGTHYLWIRGLAPSTGSDSLHAGLDGQEFGSGKNLRGSGLGSYIWISTKANGARSTLNIPAPGEHTVNVWMRESGFVVDKVVLTTDVAFDPSTINGGLGPAESSQGSPTSADLAVTKGVDNSNPAEGGTITYTVTATNNGPLDATGVVLSDILPAGLAYVSDDSGGAYDSGTGAWSVGSLPNGNLATLNITATVNTGTAGSTLTNTASVSALNEPDPVAGNDSASVSLTVFIPGGGSGAFQQDSGAGGVVSMEAENNSANVVASDGHAWLSAGGSFPGFAGTDALQALPADGVTHGSSYSTLSPQLDFQVNFVASGTHYLWIRGLAPSTGSDSLHAGLDGQEFGSGKNLRGSGTGSYIWISTKANGARSTLNIPAPGEHTVNVWMRESGFVVDKVVLTTDVAFDPSTINGGLGPAESSQGSPTNADLAVTKGVDNANPSEGGTIIYTVTATNNGPLDATGVVLSD